MTDIIPNSILSCLNQLNFDIRTKVDPVSTPGFYFDEHTYRIEHWSELCEFNYALVDHFSNEKSMINDGFLSVLAFDDIDGIVKNMTIWKEYLKEKMA